ncbi:MAG: UDP-N-acetylmuramate--L-alanine ligase [Alphaproteobacteria bacterium]|nr:UDP-N-acetylmuramate--L-alanine ligase [Alphaproteobacteria bacterium]
MKSLMNLINCGGDGKFHIIGIGGIGMSGIAEILHNLGYDVQGSDIASNDNTQRLKALGIKLFHGHDATNILDANYVVISTIIKEDNIEYMEAIARKIPIIRRSEMLAEIMRMKTCISISGSHGKTSTTSMIASVFEAARLSPTVINGGIIQSKSTNAYVGEGDYMIVEADESDATFIKIPSSIAVVTNIDCEHMDFYNNFDNLYSAFKNFIKNLPFYGFSVICMDHPVTQRLISDIIERKVITYGIQSEDANIRATNIRVGSNKSIFDVSVNLPHNNRHYLIKDISLAIPGMHNILNCLAAIAIASELDFTEEIIKEGLLGFRGVKRRFTKTGEYKNNIFIDDYAHHPVEIKATLATAKISITKPNGKIIAIFQPHKYSRLTHLFDDFSECFDDCDYLYIAPVYSAGEEQIEDYDSLKLQKSIANKYPSKHVEVFFDPQELHNIIPSVASGNDIIIFMGAGNITRWAYETPKILNQVTL